MSSERIMVGASRYIDVEAVDAGSDVSMEYESNNGMQVLAS